MEDIFNVNNEPLRSKIGQRDRKKMRRKYNNLYKFFTLYHVSKTIESFEKRFDCQVDDR